jgi:hypothetical protein
MVDPLRIPVPIARSRPVVWLATAVARWGPWPTPAVLRAARLVVAALLVLAAVLGVAAAASRWSAIQEIADRTESLSADAAAVHRALAAADAAVTSELVDGAAEPADLARHVDDELSVAVAGLARATGRVEDDPDAAAAITTLGAELPRYVGLVEQARVDRRSGVPVDQAQLDRASDLMQNSMLPMAERLRQRQAQALDNAYARVATVPVALLVVTALSVAVMSAVQLWMTRRFRRGLNLGMVMATGAVAAAVLWWTMTTLISAGYLARAQAHSRAIDTALVPAQIVALRARTAEGLVVAGRGDGPGAEREFDDNMRRLTGSAGPLATSADLVHDPVARSRLVDAAAAAIDYRAAHDRLRQTDAQGRQADALRLARATGPLSSAGAFARLDGGLTATADAERAASTAQLKQAAAWQIGLVLMTAALALFAGVAAARGIAARLREYP